ncbi:MAG: PAS domain-containing sensor histidine kinase [Verrucomicrobiota bacterium]
MLPMGALLLIGGAFESSALGAFCARTGVVGYRFPILAIARLGLFLIAAAMAVLLVGARQLARRRRGGAARLPAQTTDCTVMESGTAIAHSRLLDLSNDAILVRDMNDRIIYWNKGAEEIFGYTRDEALGQVSHELLRTDFPEPLPQIRERLYRDNRWDGELVAVRSDGARIITYSRWALDRDDQGRPTSILATSNDITVRKRVEEGLRRSEQFNRMIIESSRDCIKLLGLDGTLVWMSEVGQKIFCIKDIEQLVGKSWLEFWHGDDRVRAQASVHAAARGGSGKFIGLFVTCGQAKWWEVIITPVLDSDGNPEQLLAVSRDVTERKLAEEALRESEERFRALAENIPQLAWMNNADGWVFWYNKRWFDYTGMTLEQTQGWGWQSMQHPDYIERMTEKLKRALATGEPWEDTFPLRNREGQYRWFLSRAFPISDSSGKITRWFGTSTDITELRDAQDALSRAQNELQQHANNLETAVAERTARLRVMVGELEAFSYSLSHDMRAPLRAIVSFSQIAMGDCGGHCHVYLKKIIAAAQRLDRMIQEVLAYTQLSNQELGTSPVNVERLLKEIISERPELQLPRAEIVIEAPLLPVRGNEASLTQCLTNLLGNAVKFVPANVTPRVRIRTQDSGEAVRLWIEDNGIGICRESQAQLFELFYRVKNEANYEGTGLGLAIARKAVERMGGHIGVESEPGQGSRFWVELPKVASR